MPRAARADAHRSTLGAMKNILVLGGTGFVGSTLCEHLARHGWRITLATRRRANAHHLQHLPTLTVVEVDVHDEVALTAAVQGHTAVVNLIAILHGTPAAFEHVHVALPQKLARACQAHSVAQCVHISALGVQAQQPDAAPSHYLRSKGRGEVALRAGANASGMHLTVLRPSVIFGANDQFLNLFARLQRVFPVMPLAGAHARFQPVWVVDVARAVVRSLDLPIRPDAVGYPVCTLEACGPDVFTLKELVQLSARLGGVRSGRGRPVIALPMWMGRIQALVMEWAPGGPLMSRDNLDSMRVDNVATPGVPGLEALGIKPTSVQAIAARFLKRA
jgi:uncharacterized protein YbjT (DUF2867 family)